MNENQVCSIFSTNCALWLTFFCVVQIRLMYSGVSWCVRVKVYVCAVIRTGKVSLYYLLDTIILCEQMYSALYDTCVG